MAPSPSCPSGPPRQHSSFSGTVHQLLLSAVLGPPPRPGLLGRLDHFEILRLLGAGGMGWVFLARDASRTRGSHSEPIAVPARDVAIKVLKPELAGDPRARAYFLREVRHLQRLSHPHILPVLAVSPAPERPYFVMPFMAGGNLGDLLRPGESLPPQAGARIAREIATALHHAHRHGILHRDVKPSNVLLDAQGRAFLTDFGLARTVFNETLVDFQSSAPEGTIAYLSPGSAAGEVEDMRGDIYSFGALLYELLTGRPPFAGGTKEQIRQQILAGPPPAIRSLAAQAPPGLVHIAERAMARTLSGRYGSMAEVLRDLGSSEPCPPATQPGSPTTPPPGREALALAPRNGARSSRPPRFRLPSLVTALASVVALAAWMQSSLPGSPVGIGRGYQGTPPSQPHARLPASPPALASPNSGPDLVYASSFDPDQSLDLFLLREGDTAARNLTEDLALEASSPKVSPDGQRIAFTVSSGPSHQIWVANLDGSGKRAIPTPHPACAPVWLDDDTLYFVWGGIGWTDIYRIHLDGSGYEAVITGHLPGDANTADHPAFSPAAHLLAFCAQAPSWAPTADIYLAQPDGSNPMLYFADANDNTTDRRPVWAEDGHSLFWVRYTAEGAHRPDRGGMIVRKYLDGWTGVRAFDQIVRPGAGSMINLEAVSPDASTLLISRDEEEKTLATYDVATGRTTVLVRAWRLGGADWRPPPGPVRLGRAEGAGREVMALQVLSCRAQ